MNRSVALFTLLLHACLPPLELEPRRAPIELVGVRPMAPIPLDASIEVTLSAPIRPPDGPWPITVIRRDGRLEAIDVDLVDGSAILVRPAMSWSSSDRLTVTIGPGLRGVGDEVVVVPDPPIELDTAATPPVQTFALEGPRPGDLTPTNLHTLVLSTRGILAPAAAIVLRGTGHVMRLPVVATDSAGRWVAEVPRASGGLMAAETYKVEIDGATAASTAEGLVVTGTSADVVPPSIRVRDVDRGSGRLRVIVEASEPVLVRGAVSGSDSSEELTAPLLPRTRIELAARRPLRSGVNYTVLIEAEDLFGLRAEPLEFGVEMPEEVQVEITEIVTTPLHDWNDGQGVAFDGAPGGGAVTDADEWLELVNRSASAIDLSVVELTLRVLDAAPSEHLISAAPALYFGRGGDARAWGVGEALVIRPRGSMAQRDVVVEVLRGDVVLDRIELGRAESADHAGGSPPDLRHESIGKDGDGRWRWCEPSPGDAYAQGCLR